MKAQTLVTFVVIHVIWLHLKGFVENLPWEPWEWTWWDKHNMRNFSFLSTLVGEDAIVTWRRDINWLLGWNKYLLMGLLRDSWTPFLNYPNYPNYKLVQMGFDFGCSLFNSRLMDILSQFVCWLWQCSICLGHFSTSSPNLWHFYG
jgi:hypothetical protein